MKKSRVFALALIALSLVYFKTQNASAQDESHAAATTREKATYTPESHKEPKGRATATVDGVNHDLCKKEAKKVAMNQEPRTCREGEPYDIELDQTPKMTFGKKTVGGEDFCLINSGPLYGNKTVCTCSFSLVCHH